jgi:hypothetical protein
MNSRRFPAGWLVAVALVGCAGKGGAPGSDPSGVLTVIDSTADTVVARVAGPVPADAIRGLLPEVRIAPAVDDTSLFTEVSEVEIDRSGRFWVHDRPSNTVFLFDAAGQLLRRIGRKGGGPGEFASANGMVPLPDGGVAVWDSRNARISFFDSTGTFRTSWMTPAGFSTNNGLQTDRSGRFYLRRPVTPPREGEILGRIGLVALREGGVFRDSLVPPDLPVQRDTYLAVRRSGKDNVSQSSTSSRFAANYLWAWHPDGYFVVGHGGDYRIVVARRDGKPLEIRRELAAIPIGAEERAEEQARITYNMRQTDPDWSWSGPALPETKAPLANLQVTRDGRIWAQVAVPSERIPDAELAPSRDPKAPVVRHRTPPVFEVFDPEGRFRGRVDCRCRMTLLDAEGDLVWAIVRDENDLPAVVRFRVEPAWR